MAFSSVNPNIPLPRKNLLSEAPINVKIIYRDNQGFFPRRGIKRRITWHCMYNMIYKKVKRKPA